MLNKEAGELRGEVDTVAQEKRDTVGARLARLRQQAAMHREQLESLTQMQFLNENEYRELKSKFGNVFRAGMGAEAFHEILKSMDLDKLAQGAVARSAHDPLQAGGQAGHQAPAGCRVPAARAPTDRNG